MYKETGLVFVFTLILIIPIVSVSAIEIAINSPEDESIYYSENIFVNLTTDVQATCEYSFGFGAPDWFNNETQNESSGGLNLFFWTNPVTITEELNLEHSAQIEFLHEDIGFRCIDEEGNTNWKAIHINIEEPESEENETIIEPNQNLSEANQEDEEQENKEKHTNILTGDSIEKEPITFEPIEIKFEEKKNIFNKFIELLKSIFSKK